MRGVALLLAGSVFLIGLSGVYAGGAKETEVKAEGKTVLELWDYWADVPAMERLIEAFQKERPDVQIQRTTLRDNDLRTTIRPALTSKSGPALFSYTPGPGYVGVLADAGLIEDLSGEYERRGWNTRFFPWVIEDVTYKGRKYSAGTEVTALGVYYNKALFAERNLKVPASYDQFVETARAFVGSGIVPIMIDSKDQWPTFHYESMFFSAWAEKDTVKAVLDGRAGFEQPAFADALDGLSRLISEKLTTENPNAYAYPDANAIFKSGKAAMRPTGTWMVREYVEALKESAGFFPLPARQGVRTAPPAGIGTVWCVSAHASAAEKAAALDFIDFMLSPKNAILWYEAGVIPPIGSDKPVEDYAQLSGLFKDVVKTMQKGTVSYNLDVYLPQNVNEETLRYMQELIAGRIDGKTAVARKQKALASSR